MKKISNPMPPAGERPAPPPNPPTVQGNASLERWQQMNCGACRKWWAISDAPEARRAWYCPWCGVQNVIEVTP